MVGGRVPDSAGLAQGVFMSIGFAALSDIQADFIRKARGGTGEDGVTWPRLSPHTLAYSRRFGRGEQAGLKAAAGLGKDHKFGIGGQGGVLSKQQQERWWKLYSQALAWLAQRQDVKSAKGKAAAIAWSKLKAEGAKTKLEVYGNREHEILRDTGVLFNSLSPGRLDGSAQLTYTPPSGDGGDQQIFKSLTNGVIVGTNVPYASVHQDGSTKKKIPARPFLPQTVPAVWKERWLKVGIQAVSVAMRRHLSLQGGR